MGHPRFQNVRLKLNAALDCEAANSVVTGISHWYQVIQQAAKFFHLLCGFERSSASPFGCAITSTPTETTRAEHVCATRSVLPVIVDDLPSQGFTSVRAIAVELNERISSRHVVERGIQRQPLGWWRGCSRRAEANRDTDEQ